MNEIIYHELKKIVSEGWTDGISLVYGTAGTTNVLNHGKKSGEPIMSVTENTIFDLASVTKIFTLFAALRLVDKGILSLDAQIGDYTSAFPNIVSLHLYELLNFSRNLVTDKRIDTCSCAAEALEQLYNISCSNTPGRYSDMGAIVLGRLIDSLSGITFKGSVCEVFNLCQLNDTYWWKDLPKEKFSNTQSYDNEYISSGKEHGIVHTPTGTPHDKKAAILGVSGHAGLFSTPGDIAKFCIAILSHKIASEKALKTVCSDRYDYFTVQGQHLGLLCYKKAGIPKISEIPAQFGDSAFAISGYTGTYLLIDPDNNQFVSLNANRVFNRSPHSTKPLSSNIKGTKNYVYRKDSLLSLIN